MLVYTKNMKGAFLVRIKSEAEAEENSDLSGSVEEVDTGSGLRFRTAEELLRFMRHRPEETRPASTSFSREARD